MARKQTVLSRALPAPLLRLLEEAYGNRQRDRMTARCQASLESFRAQMMRWRDTVLADELIRQEAAAGTKRTDGDDAAFARAPSDAVQLSEKR